MHFIDDEIQRIGKMIIEGDINDVIQYAKQQDFIDNPVGRYRITIANAIHNRLDQEGLDYSVIAPD